MIFDLRKLVGRVDKRACSMVLAQMTDEKAPRIQTNNDKPERAANH